MTYEMSQPATLLYGPDTESWSIKPDAIHFATLDEAIRYAAERLSTDQRSTARIRLDRDHRIIPGSELKGLSDSLKSN
jgi:hypothetical protein